MTFDGQRSGRPGWLARYGFAALMIVAAHLVLRIPLIGDRLSSVIFLSFLLSAWYGGGGPGLFSVVLFDASVVGVMLYAGIPLTIKTYQDLFSIFLVGAIFALLVEALHRSRRRVEAGRQGLAAVLTSIGDAVIATNDAGRVVFMNPVAESLCGWPAAEAAGRPLDEVFRIVNEQTRESIENPAVRVLAEGVTVGLANHTVLVGRDGVERPIDDSGAPIRGEGGQVDGVVLVFRDVTERRMADARAVEEARRKDEFLAMLAHELRNPLAAISNAVQLLVRPDAAEMHEWSREVLARQVRQLTRLVDDLLDVSRISRGKIRLESQRLDLAEVVRSAAAAVRPLLDGRGHDLRLSIDTEPIWLEGDPVRLEQVVVNLLNNAAKYTEPGGRIDVETARDCDRGEAVVRVADTGIGIVPEMLPRVFELFAQGDRAVNRAEGGLGIGLTMVQKLVAMHGGRVEARSDGAGHGSVFTVRLPLLSAVNGARPTPDEPPRSGAAIDLAIPKPPGDDQGEQDHPSRSGGD